MRGFHPWRLAPGLVLLGVAAGCRSPPPPPPLPDGGIVASAALSPDQARQAEAFARYALGIHHELADEYDLAHAAYQKAAELDPGNEQLVLRMASTLVLQRRSEEALGIVEDFLKRQPASEDARLWLAAFYGTTGERKRVVELFREVTRQNPAKPLGWLQLAAASGRLGDPDDAAKILEEGLSKARPPTTLRRELVRIWLVRMQSTPDEDGRRAARRKAIEQLERIVAETPGDTEILYALGELLVKDDRLEDALQTFEKIERIQPGDPQVKQNLAKIFLAMDDKPKAIAILEKLARDRRNPSHANFYLAELYLQAGDTANAALHFRTAAAASTNDPAPWIKLAALEAEDDADRAAATLNEALAQMPGNPKLLEVLALVRLKQERFAETAELLQRVYDTVVAQDPEAIPSNLFFFHYAVACTHLNRARDAAGWLARARELDPALLDLYMQRAMTGTDTFREAATGVLRALAKHPGADSASVHAHLASLYLSRDKPRQAIRAFEAARAAVDRDPLQAAALDPRFHFWFGVALDQAGQTARAVEMFEACLARDPEHADALNYLAYLWAVRGERLDDALRHIRTALALDPENAAYIDTLGWIYHQQGRYAEALEQLEKADALRPGDPEILDHIRQTRDKLAP